jgi:2-polyprenyl-3-methyl-5-hydroxy-6-metoxy-1,4-benzoquinol methylase
VARAAGIQAGASVLDVGGGSGEFCELAAARGARVSGIDAAAEPYRRPDGSYRFENRFRYLIAVVS